MSSGKIQLFNSIHHIEKRVGEPLDDLESKRLKQQVEHVFDIDTLRHFYRIIQFIDLCLEMLFPAEEFVEWLTYAHGEDNSKKEDFLKRELSFTLEGDCYLRYRGFENAVMNSRRCIIYRQIYDVI